MCSPNIEASAAFSVSCLIVNVVLAIRRREFHALRLDSFALPPLFARGSHLGDDLNTTTPSSRFDHYVQILFTDTGVISSMLTELDTAFVVCHRCEEVAVRAVLKPFSAPKIGVMPG